MKLKFNGEIREFNENITVSELINITGINSPFAVELNRNVISKNKFDATNLKEGDEVEIVTFAGGG
jgi:sulfur carrier protein